MISIRVENVTKRFGATLALRDLSLAIKPGELFFLLGPSGCGKTTLLRTLAGFFFPDSGRVLFDDEDVSRLEPHKRNTGMMFQSYALWPHMTVAQNVAFGLEERRMPKAEIRSKVAEALAAVRMETFGDQRPNQLSGGQQQRVALARALVIRPRCLLLDEPLSNLDAKLRLEMREEIRRVCKEYKMTTVYVTHDQKEALSIADRMAILDAGRVLQIGTPLEVYRRPRYKAVARFIGETDFISGTVAGRENERVLVETSIGRFTGVAGDPQAKLAPGSSVTVAIRPESWRLSAQPQTVNSVRGKIGEATYLGEMAQYRFLPLSAPEQSLKILEMNPKLIGGETHLELSATADPDDVVILTE